MPVAPLRLSFDAMLPTAEIWFANAAAWNAYWTRAYVTITAANLPLATLTDAGVVKKAAKGTDFINTVHTVAPIRILSDQDGDGIDEEYYVVSAQDAAMITNWAAKIESLSANYAALKTAFETAGVIG